MVTALNPKKHILYVPQSDRGAKKPTRFVLRPMTIFDRAEIAETLTNDPNKDIRRVIELVRAVLVKWENLCDAEGDEIPYTTREDGKADDDAIACLPESILVELFNRVARAEEVEPDEAKKSASRRTRGSGTTDGEVSEMQGAFST